MLYLTTLNRGHGDSGVKFWPTVKTEPVPEYWMDWRRCSSHRLDRGVDDGARVLCAYPVPAQRHTEAPTTGSVHEASPARHTLTLVARRLTAGKTATHGGGVEMHRLRLSLFAFLVVALGFGIAPPSAAPDAAEPRGSCQGGR